ncbi:Major facilitator superfamily domain-containing protein 10 [Fusarium oxysporum f. sp. albedinis]|nr:Major facilitator superfamily domain-containing protein 10 [Fusarium oxysporum f. sp. albedinis]
MGKTYQDRGYYYSVTSTTVVSPLVAGLYVPKASICISAWIVYTVPRYSGLNLQVYLDMAQLLQSSCKLSMSHGEIHYAVSLCAASEILPCLSVFMLGAHAHAPLSVPGFLSYP